MHVTGSQKTRMEITGAIRVKCGPSEREEGVDQVKPRHKRRTDSVGDASSRGRREDKRPLPRVHGISEANYSGRPSSVGATLLRPEG